MNSTKGEGRDEENWRNSFSRLKNKKKAFGNWLLLLFWFHAVNADKGRTAPNAIQKIPSDVSGFCSAATVTV